MEILCPETEKAVKYVSLSRNTITWRIEKLTEKTKMQLNEICRNFEAIDESTDIADTPQLAIFVRGVHFNCNTTEDLLDLFYALRKKILQVLLFSKKSTLHSKRRDWIAWLHQKETGIPEYKDQI